MLDVYVGVCVLGKSNSWPKLDMLELADAGNKKQGELDVGNVLVFLNLHSCDQ